MITAVFMFYNVYIIAVFLSCINIRQLINKQINKQIKYQKKNIFQGYPQNIVRL